MDVGVIVDVLLLPPPFILSLALSLFLLDININV